MTQAPDEREMLARDLAVASGFPTAWHVWVSYADHLLSLGWCRREAVLREAAPVKMVCTECGSENVKLDCWAVWNVRSQRWELEPETEKVWCDDCASESTAEEVPALLTPQARKERE